MIRGSWACFRLCHKTFLSAGRGTDKGRPHQAQDSSLDPATREPSKPRPSSVPLSACMSSSATGKEKDVPGDPQPFKEDARANASAPDRTLHLAVARATVVIMLVTPACLTGLPNVL